ncbi:hypothetical protein DM02DRAFT_396126 [Periconia macrospinosa]|uniref:Uncharacterized protein n=1 Tax=Periconia macrospinosa TaxID=97972 RepID=A0A2V1DSK0_9PLEO|nr:hypothetical protein DM02DRAFT_396126 [Periconia macrospinosa]
MVDEYGLTGTSIVDASTSVVIEYLAAKRNIALSETCPSKAEKRGRIWGSEAISYGFFGAFIYFAWHQLHSSGGWYRLGRRTLRFEAGMTKTSKSLYEVCVVSNLHN